MNWKEILTTVGFCAIIAVCIFALLSVVVGRAAYDMGQSEGRLEILSGRVKYELQQNNDGETVWKRTTDEQGE